MQKPRIAKSKSGTKVYKKIPTTLLQTVILIRKVKFKYTYLEKLNLIKVELMQKFNHKLSKIRVKSVGQYVTTEVIHPANNIFHGT